RPGDPLFTLHAGRLSFVTAGGGPPLDPDYDWLLTIGAGSGGLELSAIPVGRAPAAVVTIRFPGVTRWDVQARAAGGAPWPREWSHAVEYAEDAIERAKLGGPSLLGTPAESLPGGFRREIVRRPWQPGLTLVTVTVLLPGRGRFDLDWLTRDRPAAEPGPAR